MIDISCPLPFLQQQDDKLLSKAAVEVKLAEANNEVRQTLLNTSWQKVENVLLTLLGQDHPPYVKPT